MRLITWIPILVLLALAGIAWTAFRSEHPLTLAFDEGPPADALADPVAPRGSETVRGTLLGEEGRPLREALVQMQAGPRLLWTLSDDDGHFQIPGVDPGSHALTVVARGYPPAVFQATSGEERVVLALPTRAPAPPAVPAAGRSELRTRLRSAGGEVDLSRFELLLTPLEDDVRAGPNFPRWGAFDAGGTCVLSDVASGRYRAQVLPRWAHAGTWPDLLTDLDGPGRAFAHPADGEWALELRSGEIRGRITDGSRATERRVEFVAGALILVRPAGSGTREGAEPGTDARSRPDARIWPPAESDAQGAFLVRDLPPGRYLVTVHAGDRHVEREVTVYPAATTTLDL